MRKIFIVLLLVFGCEDPSKQPAKKTSPSNFEVKSVTSFEHPSCNDVVTMYDSDKKVTCYVFSGCDKGGIFCIKDDVATSK